MLANIADNSTALVLTDPLHCEGSEPLHEWLTEFAARVLVPGGSLIVYTGNYRLQRELPIFSRHLRYCWLLAMQYTTSRFLPGKFVIRQEAARALVREAVPARPDDDRRHPSADRAG